MQKEPNTKLRDLLKNKKAESQHRSQQLTLRNVELFNFKSIVGLKCILQLVKKVFLASIKQYL